MLLILFENLRIIKASLPRMINSSVMNLGIRTRWVFLQDRSFVLAGFLHLAHFFGLGGLLDQNSCLRHRNQKPSSVKSLLFKFVKL
jgi:hypothetical protein